ncbi:MAG: hypothetical protein JW986_08785 [Methanotrichaceae archaeon]|nr:hypothetical protein [Methanotrichaceae archaeon]
MTMEWTYPLRKFDDIYYTIERIIYGGGRLSGFTTEEVYDNLRDKSIFRDVTDLNNFLMENGKTFRVRPAGEAWERIW